MRNPNHRPPLPEAGLIWLRFPPTMREIHAPHGWEFTGNVQECPLQGTFLEMTLDKVNHA